MLKKRWAMISSVVVALVIALAVFLRPSRILDPGLPAPGHIPANVRAAMRDKMQRHAADMRELIMYLVVLDNGGAARVAGRVYDEPALLPSSGSENFEKFLPPRFFALQAQLRAEAKFIVEAGARDDPGKAVEHFSALAKTCVTCHQAYLYDQPSVIVPGPGIAR